MKLTAVDSLFPLFIKTVFIVCVEGSRKISFTPGMERFHVTFFLLVAILIIVMLCQSTNSEAFIFLYNDSTIWLQTQISFSVSCYLKVQVT